MFINSKYKKILLIIFCVVLVSSFIYAVYYNQVRLSMIDTSGGWKTYSDSVLGVSFKYPETIPTIYIHTVDWPPKMSIINGSFICTNNGSEVALAGKTESKLISSNTYCVTKESEGAAGSVYTKYIYVTSKKDKIVTLVFTLRAVQCANYDDSQKIECENERTRFDIDSVINNIFTTIQL
jgi:hypothetical protein